MDRVIGSRSPSSFLMVSSSESVEVEAEGRDKWNENGTGSSAYSYTNHSRESSQFSSPHSTFKKVKKKRELTEPLKLLTNNSNPSLPVSAGNETDGPNSVPSLALRN